MAPTHQILCGNCKTPVQGATEPTADDVIECASCGQTDRYADVLESAKNYTTDETARHLQKSMQEAVRGSKFMTFKGDQIDQRNYRWIVGGLSF